MLKISQIEQYHQEGYLLASGLIPDMTSKKAEETLWSLLNMLPDQPQSWKTIPAYAKIEPHRNLIDITTAVPDLMACCTPEFMQTTAQLLNEPSIET
ncbi:MAG: hypothetical protein VX677_00310, partial [Candidatus Poribacteria bacterium]|nr:hypothetical protein [Candidatus Poribacteria bacterium]